MYELVEATERETQEVIRRPYNKNWRILNEFAESGLDCCRLKGWTNKKALYCKNSLDLSIKRYKMFTIKVVVRNEQVYLMRADLTK